MTGGGWSTLARDAAAIAARLPLPAPAGPVCPCGRPLEDGRHLVAAADAELRRAGAVPPHTTGGSNR